ncbi:MAG: methenyltetrahydromethanopterin cyclohydrolase [Anaerolineae bacterium]|nr:methenyltetrahydromethanopterin cyclohydrolase [Anaerolineae bacterium]
MISVNERAAEILRRMVAQAEVLGVAVHTLSNGATVIDAGIKVAGSFAAGKLFAEACLGGLGEVEFARLSFPSPPKPVLSKVEGLGGIEGGLWLPGVSVRVEHPAIACMAAQYAGWAVKRGKFFAMGSGPARALYAGEELFERLSYRDQAEVAVLLLEGRKLPDEEVAEYVAGKCGVDAANLALAIAPTASLVGSVQVAARVVETGLHKLTELGFDVEQIVAGFGTCPLAPVAGDDLQAIGLTNDAVLYGGQAYYAVQTSDEALEAIIEQVPSSASRDYGTPFYELFQRYGDFYQIDPMLFSPAEVTFNNLSTGRTFHAGGVNVELLRRMIA